MSGKNKILSAAFLFGLGKGKDKDVRKVFNEHEKGDITWERMACLKGMLEQTEIGRDTLKFLKKNRTKVQFAEIDGYGSYNYKKNKISLNPAFSDKTLALTFIHEARHAFQFKEQRVDPENLTPDTYLKFGYMSEADACAAQCVFARQMKEQGDHSFVSEYRKTGYAPVGEAFEKEFEKSNDTDKARNAAFTRWYDLRVKQKYTEQYLDSIACTARYARRYQLTHDKSAKEMAMAFCTNAEGKCYVGDPKALEAPEKLHLNEYQAQKLTKSLEPFMKRFCLPPAHLGLDKIYVKRENGAYTPVHNERKTAKINPALQSFLKNNRGR